MVWESKGCARRARGRLPRVPGRCSSHRESQGCCKIESSGSEVPGHQGWSEKSPSSLCCIHLPTAAQLGRCRDPPSQPGTHPSGWLPLGCKPTAHRAGKHDAPPIPCTATLTGTCPPWAPCCCPRHLPGTQAKLCPLPAGTAPPATLLPAARAQPEPARRALAARRPGGAGERFLPIQELAANPAGRSRLAAAHPLRHRQPRRPGARAPGAERFAYQSAGRLPAPLLSPPYNWEEGPGQLAICSDLNV